MSQRGPDGEEVVRPVEMMMLTHGQAHAMAVQDAVAFLRSASALAVAAAAKGLADADDSEETFAAIDGLLSRATQHYRDVSTHGLDMLWRLQHGGRRVGDGGGCRNRGHHGGPDQQHHGQQHHGQQHHGQQHHGQQHHGQGNHAADRSENRRGPRPPQDTSSAGPIGDIAARRAELDFAVLGTCAADQQDNLQRIHDIGPEIEEKLHAIGIMSYDQLSRLTPELIDQITDILGYMPGRIVEHDWVTQAQVLCAARVPPAPVAEE